MESQLGMSKILDHNKKILKEDFWRNKMVLSEIIIDIGLINIFINPDNKKNRTNRSPILTTNHRGRCQLASYLKTD